MKKTSLLFCSLFCLGMGTIHAQYTDLHDFSGLISKNPYGSLTLSSSGGELYGMASGGGSTSAGCIFSIDTGGAVYNELFDFNDTDGAAPFGSLVLSMSGNVLYGMTSGDGGTGGDGTVFSIHTDGSRFELLHKFNDTTGLEPFGSLVLSVSGKTLFGMTFGGGANGYGLIFSLDTDGTRFTDLYDFSPASGYEPEGSLILSADGNKLYGMTRSGGTALNPLGTLFVIDTNGAGYRVLLNFDGTNGSEPGYGQLTLSASGSVLYGMTQLGGVNAIGNIFSMDTDGTAYRDLLDFDITTGQYAWGSLILSDSLLYGMTEWGGTAQLGNIFSVDTNGTHFTNLHLFNHTDGSDPFGALTLYKGALYGMCRDGGLNETGDIFKTRSTVSSTDNLRDKSEELSVYPNPNNGNFTFQWVGTQHVVSIEIYNMLGEKVHSNSYQLLAKSYQLDLSSQPNGVYLYRVLGEDGSLVGEGKVVVER